MQPARNTSTAWPWLVWPVLACVIGLVKISERMDLAVQFDALHVYLPAAREFMAQGWAFLLTPESYRVVPLAYLWPALWMAETEWIRLANCGLWIACVFLLWSTARQLGGNRCGVIALVLWTIHPTLHIYFPTELTEPVFLFGLLLWTWAMVRLMQAPSNSLILGAAAGLCITLLSRPVLQLVAPLALLACASILIHARARKSGGLQAGAARAIAFSLMLGLLVPVALVIKNGLVFGLWGLGTGSGTGLYLGTNPLFQGTEPAYLGFHYDNNLLAQLTSGTGDHLGLAADRAARLAGVWQLQSMPLGEAIQFLARKLWWWLAHHPAPLQVHGNLQRQLRLFEVASVLLALLVLLRTGWHGGLQGLAERLPEPARAPRARLAASLFVLLVFGAMLVQLLPILYNDRYSTALLDPWLIVLAALALALLTAPLNASLQRQSWILRATGQAGVLPVLLLPLLPLLLGSAVYNYAKRHEVVAIDRTGATQALFTLPADRITTQNLLAQGPNSWQMTEGVAVVSLELSAHELATLAASQPHNAIWRLNLAITPNGGKCKPADVAYHLGSGAILGHYSLVFKADGQAHTTHIHANHTLRPTEPGRLRLVFKCPSGTAITWHETALLNSIQPQAAAAHIPPLLAP